MIIFIDSPKMFVYRQYERGFSPRRSRSRAALSDELRDPPSRSLSRTRSKSQPRIYDPDGIRGNGEGKEYHQHCNNMSTSAHTGHSTQLA